MLRECLLGYDRILCYSEWARLIVQNTLGLEKRDLDQIPHGIDSEVFKPHPRTRQRQMFGQMAVGRPVPIPDDELLVGIVATNQARKDWGLGLSTCAALAKLRRARIWMHTDVLDRHWSIPYLLADLGLGNGNMISLGHLSDEVMARLYSACDVTLGIGSGEGFGYPIFESIACGTPCIHGDYGGAPEHTYRLPLMLVSPQAMRYEGIYNCLRPVFTAYDWRSLVEARWKDRVSLPIHLDWNNLWPKWEAWFRKGIQ
jgi:glycosyltransferase involved in cell wall biosynthesis